VPLGKISRQKMPSSSVIVKKMQPFVNHYGFKVCLNENFASDGVFPSGIDDF